MKIINIDNIKTIELQDKRPASNIWSVCFTTDDTYKVFKLFPWPPHFEERQYNTGCVSEKAYDGHISYGESTLAKYNAYIDNAERKVYFEPRIIITFNDGSEEYFYFREYKNALKEYNELNQKLNANNKQINTDDTINVLRL